MVANPFAPAVLRWSDKDPDEVLDYELNWAPRLAGDVIDSSIWIIGPDSVLVKNSDSRSDSFTVIWLSGGTVGTTYELTNRITTANGDTMDQTVLLQITVK